MGILTFLDLSLKVYYKFYYIHHMKNEILKVWMEIAGVSFQLEKQLRKSTGTVEVS